MCLVIVVSVRLQSVQLSWEIYFKILYFDLIYRLLLRAAFLLFGSHWGDSLSLSSLTSTLWSVIVCIRGCPWRTLVHLVTLRPRNLTFSQGCTFSSCLESKILLGLWLPTHNTGDIFCQVLFWIINKGDIGLCPFSGTETTQLMSNTYVSSYSKYWIPFSSPGVFTCRLSSHEALTCHLLLS